MRQALLVYMVQIEFISKFYVPFLLVVIVKMFTYFGYGNTISKQFYYELFQWFKVNQYFPYNY